MNRAVAVVSCCVAIAACGSTLRTVPVRSHPTTSPVEPLIVEYPPPPAEVEVVPDDPGEPCAWMDGHWQWGGRRWSWKAGAWVVPPEGCFYTPPITVWVPSEDHGELYYLRPRWYPEGADTMDPAKVLGACGDPQPCGEPPGPPGQGAGASAGVAPAGGAR